LGLVLAANGYSEFKVKKLPDGEWDIDIAPEDYNKPKFTMFTGNNEESKILLKIFNSDFETLPQNIKSKLPKLMTSKDKDKDKDKNASATNLRGELIKVIMITQSGAEGISLKNVRQVHIMEPYWNNVRMSQVVGRAVRTCSHVNLPPEERNVEVFTYYTVFTPELLEKSFTLKTKDKGLTTDEYIFRIAKRKAAIINSILDLLKRAAVDCGVNAKQHKNVKCLSFPVNMDESALVYNNNIRDDMMDDQYENDIIDNEWKGKVLKTKVGNFVINTVTNVVYNYDLYLDSGKLVKVGVWKEENGKYSIVSRG
jgi:superfamily II DNA or RNA helicase